MNKFFLNEILKCKMLSEDYVSQQQECKIGQKKRFKILREIISKPECYIQPKYLLMFREMIWKL